MQFYKASLVAAVAAATPALAGVVTFDPADGYDLGTSLVAQSDWAGNGSLYSITSLGGGNGAAQSAATNQANFANNRFTPSAAFLGTPTTDTANTVYDFSLQLRNDQAATEDGFGVAHRIRIGGTDSAPIIQFQVFDNGVLQYNDGGSSVSVNNVNNARLDLDDTTGRFLMIEGSIDFSDSTYDLTVDGVQQGTDLALVNSPSQFGQVTLQWGPSNSSPAYRQISLDNLSLSGSVIPEPGSLAAVGLLGLVGLRRRR
jgi:hypothetical protein